jgi:hypothetical protein
MLDGSLMVVMKTPEFEFTAKEICAIASKAEQAICARQRAYKGTLG